MDVALPTRAGREIRLRAVSRPEKPLAILLDRLDLPLPRRPKRVQNVVETFAGKSEQTEQMAKDAKRRTFQMAKAVSMWLWDDGEIQPLNCQKWDSAPSHLKWRVQPSELYTGVPGRGTRLPRRPWSRSRNDACREQRRAPALRSAREPAAERWLKPVREGTLKRAIPLSAPGFRLAGSGLRRSLAGSPASAWPNRVRYPADWSFTSCCLPPLRAATRLDSVTNSRASIRGGLAPP